MERQPTVIQRVLTAGPFDPPGVTIRRSGIRWMCEDGHRCRAGEVVAYCNLGLFRAAASTDLRPFAEEWRDLQVGFAVPAAGTLHRADGLSSGGQLDRAEYVFPWTADLVLGHLDAATAGPGEMRLLMVAGQRMTELAEVRTGLLTGWHSRARAWWGDGTAPVDTILSLGTCEQAGIVRGQAGAFLDLFEATSGPAQAILVTDEPLVPCARVVLEQVMRSPAKRNAIAADMRQGFAVTECPIGAGDWLFMGALLQGLQASPATAVTQIVTRQTLTETGPPGTILLSLDSELRDVLRHRRLGYTVCCHDFRLRELGPATRSWLQAEFEPLRRTAADIGGDYARLADAIRAQSGGQLMVLNKAHCSPFQPVQAYAGFATPLADELSEIRDQDMNLMLHDVARSCGVAVVDVDRIVAEYGAQRHLPDRIHHSGVVQADIRREILHQMRRSGVAGFAARMITLS